MEIVSLIIQLISGAVGGTAAGKASPNFDLGAIGNLIAGAVGGGVGGQILSASAGVGGQSRGRARYRQHHRADHCRRCQRWCPDRHRRHAARRHGQVRPRPHGPLRPSWAAGLLRGRHRCQLCGSQGVGERRSIQHSRRATRSPFRLGAHQSPPTWARRAVTSTCSPQPCRGCVGRGKELVVLQDVVEIDEPTAAVVEGGDAMTAIAIRPEAVGLFERMHFAAS